MSSIEKVAKILKDSETAVAFTGAGISTESGVPDFRSPGGVWDRFDPDLFTIQKLKSDPEGTWEKLVQVGEEMMDEEIKPNPGHLALADLEELGILEAVITQNVDNLHQEAGNSPNNVIEVHGNLRKLECMNCGERRDFSEELEEIPPTCNDCSSIMKPAAVLFGEQLPQEALLRSQSLSEKSDAFLVIGSSLTVQPAASFPSKAAQTGAELIIVNRDPTPLDDKAEVVLQGNAGEILPKIVKKIKELQ